MDLMACMWWVFSTLKWALPFITVVAGITLSLATALSWSEATCRVKLGLSSKYIPG